MKSASLNLQVLQTLGSAIIGGELPVGCVLTLDELQRRFGVSRTVVRDAVKALQAQNLVSSTPRVGIRVLPRTQWDRLAPAVIRWRLASDDRIEALREISELRMGLEPAAARLAAARATPQQVAVLQQAAYAMTMTAAIPDLQTYLRHDIRLHRTMLEATGNQMVASLAYIIEEVLTGRTQEGLMPDHPNPDAVALHKTVADAIGGHDGASAEAAMREIVTEAQFAAEQMAVGQVGSRTDGGWEAGDASSPAGGSVLALSQEVP